jgi:hypothetical protein
MYVYESQILDSERACVLSQGEERRAADKSKIMEVRYHGTMRVYVCIRHTFIQ